jgi:hypothetical protein
MTITSGVTQQEKERQLTSATHCGKIRSTYPEIRSVTTNMEAEDKNDQLQYS